MALYEINPNAMRGSGTFFKGRAGEALGRAKLVYKASDGRWNLADADAVATLPTLGITLDSARIAGQIVRVLKAGYIGQSTWTWTTGGRIYASTVAGELTQTPPAGVDDTIQRIGVASRTNMVFFDPQSGGGEGCSILEGATAYVGFDECKESYANYFLCDGTDDYVQIQEAIDYLATRTDSGTLHAEEGIYNMGAGNDITFTAGDKTIVQGDGIPKIPWLPETSGGTVFNFDDDGQLTAGSAAHLIFKDIGFNFDGTYTDSCIDLYDENVVDSYRCYYNVRAIVPAGNPVNPDATPSGVALLFGESGGPPGNPYVWRDNTFVDTRQGTNADNHFAGWEVECLIFEGNYIHVRHAAGLVTPNMFWITPVSYARISDFTGFMDAGYAGQYEHQWFSNGANKRYLMHNVQFLAAAHVSGSHFTTNGELFIYGNNPIQIEGGGTPVLPSVAGTVHIRFSGEGYEYEGTATILNGNTAIVVAHPLVATPNTGNVSGAENHVEVGQLAWHTAGAANFTIEKVSAGNVTANRLVSFHVRYYT